MNNTVDLNLLIVFDAMWRFRSVSRAAEAIGMSQPAVSNALKRLREQLQDRLFVRTAQGMLPTLAAQELGKTISAALAQIAAGLNFRHEFHPASQERTFTITLTDIGSLVFLPRLLEHCNREAPGIAFRTLHLPSADIARALVAGDVDLAVGFVPDLHSGIYQQLLFNTDYVCMVRKDHPSIGDQITRKEFLEAMHAVAEVAESQGHYIVERELNRLNLRIGLRLPHFMALPSIIARTDMVATVARPLAVGIRDIDNLKLLEHPVRLPRPSIKQFWHERFHDDPANQWLRRKMYELFFDYHPWDRKHGDATPRRVTARAASPAGR